MPPTPPTAPLSNLLVILNPAASRGGAARSWPAAARVLDRAGLRYRLVVTAAPGHATTLAETAEAEGHTAAVAVGGDGTVHEVANGLLQAIGGDGRPTLPLGIIPVGSGNDFAKLVGVPPAPNPAARHLLGATVRAVDAGRVGNRFFTNGVGVGFDASVAIEARRVPHLKGMAMYGWAVLRVLRAHRSVRMRVELDGTDLGERPRTLVTVGNGACHGGGFWICPAAQIDDGLLDICTADAFSRTELLRLLPHVLRGSHVGRAGVEMHRARRVRITSSEPLPVHADGEIVAEAAHELEIEVLPGRLTVLG